MEVEIEKAIQQEPGLQSCLNVVRRSTPGLTGWGITPRWAQALIKFGNLSLQCRNGDISGEKSALFQHEGETIRLKQDWKGSYLLFHGDWAPDPHWTGN